MPGGEDLAPLSADCFAIACRATDGTRKRAKLFSGFLSHYFIHDRYGRPGKGNDKGAVEGLVGYDRRNFMVPIPRFATWDALNFWLAEQCRKRQADVLRGHSDSIGHRLARDLDVMMDLPASPFDPCEQATGQVNSQSLVRYKTNDYSVPGAYGHRDVWLRGYVDQVVIGCGSDVIARHPRCWDREDMVFDPVQYLPLLEPKVGALDQAAPLAGWDLPEEFATLRCLMEAQMIKAGRREYVQVLRLLETFEMADLQVAVKNALRMKRHLVKATNVGSLECLAASAELALLPDRRRHAAYRFHGEDAGITLFLAWTDSRPQLAA